MSDPIGLMGGDDPKYRKFLYGHEKASPEGAGGGGAPSGTPGPPAARPFRGFDVERATYERLKPELLTRAEGRFVVVVGEEWAGPVETADDAESMGYARFGIGPLYIKRVTAEEPVDEISRDIMHEQSNS
jgi:hypothetical protein